MPDTLKKHVRQVADWPKKNVVFQDLNPILREPRFYKKIIKTICLRYQNKNIKKIVGIEARGFIFAAMLANELEVGFVPIRKKGKLPDVIISEEYNLEYGKGVLEISKSSLKKDEVVVLVDDVLATGGTAQAAIKLIKRLDAKIFECFFVADISHLNGKKNIPHNISSYCFMNF